MIEHISSKDFRKQFIEPAQREQKADENFMKQLTKQVTTNKKKTSIKSLGRSEHDIQSNILERLAFLKDGFFWRENSGQFSLESGGKKRFFRAGISGISDIMGVWKGKPVAIEVKRPETKKNVSADQKAFLQRFRDCGGIGIVCWDDKEVINLLEDEYNKML